MEKVDVRKLEPAAREQLRRTVIRMLGRGRGCVKTRKLGQSFEEIPTREHSFDGLSDIFPT